MSCKMPVSAALLVTGGGGQDATQSSVPVQIPVRQQQNFTRGDKTSSSVRLRKRRDDVTQPGRKINRHSGDFSYFAPRKNELCVKSVENVCSNNIRQASDPSDSEANWNYITFPNGVACVQEVNIGQPGHSHHQCQPSPVLVTMREAPGVNQVKLRSNLHQNRAVSASVMNLPEQHSQNPFRKSGDFSLYNDSHNYKALHTEIEDVNVRRRPHARSHSQQPIKTGNNNNISVPLVSDQSKMYHQHHTPHHLVTPNRPGQAPVVTSAAKTKKEDKNVTKRCSGEFEFKRINRRSGDFHQLAHVGAQDLDKAEEQSFVERMISRELYGDSGSEGSEESGIFSTGSSHESPRKEARKPGLGRRAITQVNMREKKNSYNHALAKSQENLVKVCKSIFCFPYHHFSSSFLSTLLIILEQELVINGNLLLKYNIECQKVQPDGFTNLLGR